MTNERYNEILECQLDTVIHGVQIYRAALNEIVDTTRGKAAFIAKAALSEVSKYAKEQEKAHGIKKKELESFPES